MSRRYGGKVNCSRVPNDRQNPISGWELKDGETGHGKRSSEGPKVGVTGSGENSISKRVRQGRWT